MFSDLLNIGESEKKTPGNFRISDILRYGVLVWIGLLRKVIFVVLSHDELTF